MDLLLLELSLEQTSEEESLRSSFLFGPHTAANLLAVSYCTVCSAPPSTHARPVQDLDRCTQPHTQADDRACT